MRHKFAVQLYTLRDELKKDFFGTLREVRKMGWEAVQIDGLFGHMAEEIAEILRETGLKAAGMHVGLDRINHEFDQVLHEAKLFRTTDFFCHYLEEDLQNPEGYRKVKRDLLEAAKKAVPRGFRVGYHHHDFEFRTMIGGEPALDFLLAPENGQFIYPEPDTYWLKKAGIDPLGYINKFPRRIPILHLKDMAADEKGSFAEIGTGRIDFKPILEWGEANGVEWYAVEQDVCPGNPFDSLALSRANLLKLAERITEN